jgi:hypothetical protein
VSTARWNLKEAGFGEPTNPRANLWPDVQKSHIRLHARVRLLYKPKPNYYTESHGIDETDIWRERCVWYPGRPVRNAPKSKHYREAVLSAQDSAEAIVAESIP